jgi:hypothetical protein
MMCRYKYKFPLFPLKESVIFLLMLVAGHAKLLAQVNPPRPMTLTVSSVQSMNFGSFAITGVNGGTVTISNIGMRTSAGDLFLTGSGYYEGIFTIDAIIGTSLLLMNGSASILTGSNGGSVTMTLGQTDPELPYTTISPSTIFHQGATLTVGSVSANPPGVYTGTYEIIINHE